MAAITLKTQRQAPARRRNTLRLLAPWLDLPSNRHVFKEIQHRNRYKKATLS